VSPRFAMFGAEGLANTAYPGFTLLGGAHFGENKKPAALGDRLFGWSDVTIGLGNRWNGCFAGGRGSARSHDWSLCRGR
jgi:hypothetical protein